MDKKTIKIFMRRNKALPLITYKDKYIIQKTNKTK